MCGFTGYLNLNFESPVDPRIAFEMGAMLNHRGPDDCGLWSDGPIALAHRRLSILDLSSGGRQPMLSHSGRYVIAFNGEIYNYKAVRENLVGRQDLARISENWRGHSDTEVLLEAIETWGLTSALSKVSGMFAFALWDNVDKALYLVRDRIGEKPLYYGVFDQSLLFGSELKALERHPLFKAQVDRNTLSELLRFGYISAPRSIYKDVMKLPPGCYIEFSKGRGPELSVYWEPAPPTGEVHQRTQNIQGKQAINKLNDLLIDAVQGQMIADVPVGAFLSGGIDSTAVVSAAQISSLKPIDTFALGFRDNNYDEIPNARAVAEHLRTNHHELYLSESDAMSVIPDLPHIYDEPFGDTSQIPTVLLSRYARSRVKVCLTGDGGDELFGGYERYGKANRISHVVCMLPSKARVLLSKILLSIARNDVASLQSLPVDLLHKLLIGKNLPGRMEKLGHLLLSNSGEDLYRTLISQWTVHGLVLGSDNSTANDSVTGSCINPKISFDQLMRYDIKHSLPDDILCKVDRAAMSAGLETRIPLLDERIVDFALNLPIQMKVKAGLTKYILRKVVDNHVPNSLMNRPKKGFGLPLEHWLRGALRPWAEELLDPERMRDEGFLNPEPIQKKWKQHLSGQYNWKYSLWSVLSFQSWLRRA